MKLNNNCEVAAAVEYEKEGWKVADSGWPDFLLYRWSGGRIEVKFAEIKSDTAPVRNNQQTVLTVLSVLAPTVVCRKDGVHFQETIITSPLQDNYYHRTDADDWTPCSHHETCRVKYHVCEPGRTC